MTFASRGGLGALGWTPSWSLAPPAQDQSRRSGVACGFPQVGHNVICATPGERQFMVNQGCVTTTVDGFDVCQTSQGNQGGLWCCPPGRPGTAETAGTTVAYQNPIASGDIRELQQWINSIAGCSAGTVDGIYGPNTNRGLECAAQSQTWYEVSRRFPWISTVRSTPTGQSRPPNFTFNPGLTAKTPEQMVASGGGGGRVSNTGSTQQDMQIDQQRREQAGIIGGLPWWGWALIGVGGLAFLGIVGSVALGDEEEDRDRDPRKRRGRDRRDREEREGRELERAFERYEEDRRLLARDYRDGYVDADEFEDLMAEIDDREYERRAERAAW